LTLITNKGKGRKEKMKIVKRKNARRNKWRSLLYTCETGS
jgi:hypothetical protein